MEDKKVKGTMLIDFVRTIRANKDKDWNKYLKPEDWDIINSLILPAKWYPYELYNRCGNAAFELIGKGNLETARYNGQLVAKKLFEGTYKSVISTGDPLKGLNQYVLMYSSFFNFASLKFKKLGEKHVEIQHDHNPDDAGNIESYCHQLVGILETIVQMTDGKDCKINFGTKEWEGAPETIFEITWQ